MFRFCIFFVFLFLDVEGENVLLNYGIFFYVNDSCFVNCPADV